jgi:arabinose-5-phosphate isomerase
MNKNWIPTAREVLEAEAQVIAAAAGRLEHNLAKAVQIILDHPGKVVVSDIGKFGDIGQNIAATLASTGTPAVYLHAAEAVHVDLVIYPPENLAI